MGDAPAKGRMTSDEFLLWAMQQPRKYELLNGEVVAMAPERVIHAVLKGEIFVLLRAAIRDAGLDCMALPDGVAVAVDDTTTYEPDALVRCGPILPDDATRVTDPLIIVEVLSPSTQAIDTGTKLIDYFRLPSLRHYLIVRTDRAIIHHERDAAGAIATRIIRDGTVALDPPGIILRDVFGSA